MHCSAPTCTTACTLPAGNTLHGHAPVLLLPPALPAGPAAPATAACLPPPGTPATPAFTAACRADLLCLHAHTDYTCRACLRRTQPPALLHLGSPHRTCHCTAPLRRGLPAACVLFCLCTRAPAAAVPPRAATFYAAAACCACLPPQHRTTLLHRLPCALPAASTLRTTACATCRCTFWFFCLPVLWIRTLLLQVFAMPRLRAPPPAAAGHCHLLPAVSLHTAFATLGAAPPLCLLPACCQFWFACCLQLPFCHGTALLLRRCRPACTFATTAYHLLPAPAYLYRHCAALWTVLPAAWFCLRSLRAWFCACLPAPALRRHLPPAAWIALLPRLPLPNPLVCAHYCYRLPLPCATPRFLRTPHRGTCRGLCHTRRVTADYLLPGCHYYYCRACPACLPPPATCCLHCTTPHCHLPACSFCRCAATPRTAAPCRCTGPGSRFLPHRYCHYTTTATCLPVPGIPATCLGSGIPRGFCTATPACCTACLPPPFTCPPPAARCLPAPVELPYRCRALDTTLPPHLPAYHSAHYCLAPPPACQTPLPAHHCTCCLLQFLDTAPPATAACRTVIVRNTACTLPAAGPATCRLPATFLRFLGRLPPPAAYPHLAPPLPAAAPHRG